MKIQINDDWSMDCDTLNVILSHRIAKAGQMVGKGKRMHPAPQDTVKNTYHRTYREALKRLVDIDLLGIDSIADIVARIDELQRHIDALPIIEKTGRGAKHGV